MDTTTLLIVLFVVAFALLALLPFIHRSWSSRRGDDLGDVATDVVPAEPAVAPAPGGHLWFVTHHVHEVHRHEPCFTAELAIGADTA